MRVVVLFLGWISVLSSCGRSGSRSDETNDQDAQAISGPFLSVFGDSVASGVFADTEAGQKATEPQARSFAALLSELHQVKKLSPEYYEILKKHVAKPELTALSGKESYAVVSKLSEHTKKNLALKSFALPGATSKTLKEQIEKARHVSFPRHEQGYFIVHVGGNDFCDRVNEDETAAELNARIQEIAQLHPLAKIFIVQIPRVTEVLRFANVDALQLPGKTMKCSDMRRELSLCDQIPLKNGEPLDQGKEFDQEITRRNEKIKSLVKNHHAQRAVFINYDFADLKAEHLAIDCFHLSKKGQEKLGNAVWQSLSKEL